MGEYIERLQRYLMLTYNVDGLIYNEMKGLNKKISEVYVLPLPYEIQVLPPLILHNPLSVMYYLYQLVFGAKPTQVKHTGRIEKKHGICGVRIDDPSSAISLWQQGFFGKGTLSRSEPSWFGRTARRLGLDGGELTLEEITELRRAKRRQFKLERDLAQKQELAEKRRREGLVVDESPLFSLETKKEADEEIEIRDEDRQLINGETIVRLEYLHLMPAEAVFLRAGLDVLQIEDQESLPELLLELLPTPEAWREYVVYHYFRSQGWCVRAGVKFGVDLLLYRRGPPFHHAEFAVLVMDPIQSREWWWIHANMRVVSGAKKTLTLTYVEGPAPIPQWNRIKTVQQFRDALRMYSVKPIVLSRFAPARNRD